MLSRSIYTGYIFLPFKGQLVFHGVNVLIYWAVQLNAAMILVKRETHVFTANAERGKARGQEWGCQLYLAMGPQIIYYTSLRQTIIILWMLAIS